MKHLNDEIDIFDGSCLEQFPLWLKFLKHRLQDIPERDALHHVYKCLQGSAKQQYCAAGDHVTQSLNQTFQYLNDRYSDKYRKEKRRQLFLSRRQEQGESISAFAAQLMNMHGVSGHEIDSCLYAQHFISGISDGKVRYAAQEALIQGKSFMEVVAAAEYQEQMNWSFRHGNLNNPCEQSAAQRECGYQMKQQVNTISQTSHPYRRPMYHCDYCNYDGHTQDRCWFLHPEFNPHRKPRNFSQDSGLNKDSDKQNAVRRVYRDRKMMQTPNNSKSNFNGRSSSATFLKLNGRYLTSNKFMVDSGAEVSLLNRKLLNEFGMKENLDSNETLVAVNGRQIKHNGKIRLNVQLAGAYNYVDFYVTNETDVPLLLGKDAMMNLGVKVLGANGMNLSISSDTSNYSRKF